MIPQIEPHGGKLINRLVKEEKRQSLIENTLSLKQIHLDKREMADLEMIAIGAFSPLEGFMNRKDYESVLEEKRLANGLPWTVPITLSVSKEKGATLKEGEEIALLDDSGANLGTLYLEEKYRCKLKREAVKVYGTEDRSHPGVNRLYQMGDVLLGGKISVLRPPVHTDFLNYRLTPHQTRDEFKKRGWRRIVSFQTRNPIHRAHEYIQKCALEMADGLLLHPLVGETKKDDLPAKVRIRSYEIVLQKYYPKDRVVMAVFPAAMRYAGPREAVFHAIVRKNYGSTHFIVGRDHAGVGRFYDPLDAHRIFDEFEEKELGITPLFFDHAFFCRRCGCMSTLKTCPHNSAYHTPLSGTKVRSMLKEKMSPPMEIMRPEVAQVLIKALEVSDYQI
ncbi:MAG: sulfate adenylyltransferase [Desulfobacteraceae bacterium]|nr:MAG: sulfate adenylyltransferase [Desulfobacteraceae bacterium]